MALVSAGLFLTAIAAALLIAPHGPVYWDTFGYVRQAIDGDVGGLGLGRPVFVITSHALARAWLAAGGSPWEVEPVLRGWWTACSAATALLTWVLAGRLGLGRRAAIISGAAVALSPAVAHAGGTVLTDGAAAALFVLMCVTLAPMVQRPGPKAAEPIPKAHDPRPMAFLSGAIAGLAVGVREQSLMNLAVLGFVVLAMPAERRWRAAAYMAAGFLIAFVAPVAYVLITQPGYLETLRTWATGMQHDRALKTFGWGDAMTFGGWLLSLGPATTVAAIGMIARPGSPVWRPASAFFTFVVPSLAQIAAVGLFLGIAYSPRFLLSAFPVAIAIPGARVMDGWAARSPRRTAAVALALVVPLVVAAPIVRARSRPIEAILAEWPSRLASVPADSVIVSGQPCAAVPLVRAILAHDASRTGPAPDWVPLCPGWGWPADLPAVLDGYRRAGRTIAIDLRDGSWTGTEQRAALADVRRYLAETSVPQSPTQAPIVVWE